MKYKKLNLNIYILFMFLTSKMSVETHTDLSSQIYK